MSVFLLYTVFLYSLARLGLKLFWLILMAVLDSTLKYFVLSLFVCLRLSGHTQLPPVLARPPPSRLFLTPSTISVKTKHSFAKLASTKWIINKLSRRVCDYPGLVNLSIGILVYFFLDKCKYNDARDIISCSVSSRGRGCWTQLKPNQGRGWVKTIMVCNELWTLELRLNRIQMGIQVKCDYNVRKSELSSEIFKFNINEALIYPTIQHGWNIGT